MKRKTIAIIVLGLVLLASLLACGYFGVKTLRRSQLRRAGMAAYEKKDYEQAERLLQQYVQKDPNGEAEYAALADIYHEFGNTGMEAQMWQRASSLNPLNKEYRENMLNSAVKAASYDLLHGILGQKTKMGEELTDRELYLYVISSYRSGFSKDGDDAYKKAIKANPEAFHKDELGRLAELMATSETMTEDELSAALEKAKASEDPVVRFEALYNAVLFAAQRQSDDEANYEGLLKQLVETNYYAGTPILADFYFSKYRFPEMIEIVEPYLKTIDNLNLYLLYAESCVFEDKLDELKALREKLLKKTGAFPLLGDYCEILIAYLENDEEKLNTAVHKSGKLISSPLSRFIRLRVAMNQGSFNEILAVAQEIISYPSFHDLHKRAVIACLDYLSEQMQKQENRNDPSRMAELAKVLAGYLQGNRLLTEIILVSQYKKGLATESDLLTGLKQFPDDLLLLRVTAEYLLFNDKAEQALALLEQVVDKDPEDGGSGLDFLYMLALDQMGRHDEAEVIFRRLVEETQFDLDLLAEYFRFCRENKRAADLSAMADKLESASDDKLKSFAVYFRAEALILTEDEAKTQEALNMLAATPNDNPEFTLYAANRLSEADKYDEAEAKYKAIQKTYTTPSLILVNLSELYQSKGDRQKALETAKEAFSIEKRTMLPAFVYAKRLSEDAKYEDAVAVLNFPRRAVDYRPEVIELWADCMRKVIEKNIASEKYQQAEEQCKHLLVIVPEDAFGQEKLDEVRKLMHPDDQKKDEAAEPAAS
ncbi:MAG: hypothetical protein J6Y95_00140 [Lachnospiraceae bacterium]|nr:hypothetical protein [Lachnospiraceae bacterium]